MSDLTIKLIEIAFSGLLAFATGLLTKLIFDVRQERREDKIERQKFEEQHRQDVMASMEAIKNDVAAVKQALDDHIAESMARDIRSQRRSILNFANSCMRGDNHTKEEYDFMIQSCVGYTNYCQENDIENGVADKSIKFINDSYDKKMLDNSFLKEQ